MQISLALVAPNTIAREGLARILGEQGFEIVAQVSGPEDPVLDSAVRDQTNVLILLDASVKGDKCEVLEQVHERHPDARIAVLAETFEFDSMVNCFRGGAHGFLVKEIGCKPLVTSLRLIAQGEKVLPSHLADYLPDQSLTPLMMDGEQSLEQANLSDREQQVLRCLMVGYPNKIISRHLNISEATVKVHVKAILRKLRVSNRTQAAIWASGRGLDQMDYSNRAMAN
ncbi:hypothetical protein GCM10023219_20960 [Stakelama sediminis]|uniref:Two-component system nitrate/nitrite response regulator NarL n=1 Tax=Stakelama sediminis TaxID=463200 RepID=A0A840Z2N6_9SPHN|nr:two-component system nitrate/nitrite response regulator NarL [Stakelama sediminis]